METQIIGSGQNQGVEISVNGVMEAYRLRSRLVVHASTWRVNPKVTRETYAEKYEENPIIAERDYGGIAPRSVESAVRDKLALEQMATNRESAFDSLGAMKDWFKGDPRYEYYMHIDLSKNRDNTGLAMSHYDPDLGKVYVDCIYTLKNQKNWTLNFGRVEEIIREIKARGFKLKVSFDGWNSAYMMERLNNTGIEVTLYSVDRGLEAYDTLISAIFSERVDYPYDALFIRELAGLRLYGGTKYDHVANGGSKDTSDAVAGSVARCYLSIAGSLLSQSEVDAVVSDDNAFLVSYDEGYPKFEDVIEVSRAIKYGIRVDAVEDQLVIQIGHQDRQDGIVVLDGFYTFTDYGFADAGCEHVLNFLHKVNQTLQIFAFSLNEGVPYELIQFVQQTGKKFTTSLAARKNNKGQLVRSSGISRKAVNLTIQQIKKGAVQIPQSDLLIRDLKYITIDNQMRRVFVGCFAGFVDFMMKQHTVGVESREMAQPSKGVPTAAGRSLGMPGLPTHGITGGGGREIDQIRARNRNTAIPGGSAERKVQKVVGLQSKRNFAKPMRG